MITEYYGVLIPKDMGAHINCFSDIKSAMEIIRYKEHLNRTPEVLISFKSEAIIKIEQMLLPTTKIYIPYERVIKPSGSKIVSGSFIKNRSGYQGNNVPMFYPVNNDKSAELALVLSIQDGIKINLV
jgi:hypothetical protein